MLKRRRPSSPLPSSPSIALIPDLPDTTHRHVKRRRVAPPVLDGEARGWGIRTEEHSDGEEDDDDDELLSQGSRGRDNYLATTGEYKDANSVLHDLHALHQHRLMFPPAPLPPHHSNQFSCPPYSTSSIVKSIIPQMPKHLAYHEQHNTIAIPELGNNDMNLEVERVKERYEDTNKLLGSLFLSRRRELGADSE